MQQLSPSALQRILEYLPMRLRTMLAACNRRWREAGRQAHTNTRAARSDGPAAASSSSAAAACFSSASAAAAATPAPLPHSAPPSYASIWTEYAAMDRIDQILPRFSVQSSFVSDCARMGSRHNAAIPAHAGGWIHDGLLRLMSYNVFMWQRPAPSAATRNADNRMATILTILRASPDVAVLQEVIETCRGYKGSNTAPRIAPLFEREGYAVFFQPLLQHGPPDHFMGNMLLVRGDLMSSGRVHSKPLSMQFEHALTRGQGEPRGFVCVAIDLMPAEPVRVNGAAATAAATGAGQASANSKKRAHSQTNSAGAPSAAAAATSAAAFAPRAATSAAASAAPPASPASSPPRLHFYGFHLDCWDESEGTRMSELQELLAIVKVDADDAAAQHLQQLQQKQQKQSQSPAAAAIASPPSPPPVFAVLAGDYNAVRQADYIQPLPAPPTAAAAAAAASSSLSSCFSAADCSLSPRARPVWSMLRDVNRALLRQDDLETPTLVHDTLRAKGWVDSFTAAAAAATATDRAELAGASTKQAPPPNWTAWSGTAVDFLYVKQIQTARGAGPRTKVAAAAPSSFAAAAAAASPPSLRLPIAGSYVMYSAESDHVPILVDIDLHACARMSTS